MSKLTDILHEFASVTGRHELHKAIDELDPVEENGEEESPNAQE